MSELLKTIVEGHMDIYKKAYAEGYAAGKADAYKEMKPEIDKIATGLKEIGRKPIDELCTCGHLRSEHDNTVSPGHGACACSVEPFVPCECKKYTWKEFVYGKV